MSAIHRIIRFLPAVLFLIMIAGQSASEAQTQTQINVEVSCEWDDEENRDGTRPDRVVVTLYANGKEAGRMLTLSEENGWSGSFHEMAVYQDGERQSYSVVEERVEGYTETIIGSDVEGYRIINIHDPLPVGRSGQEEIDAKKAEEQGKHGEGTIVATVVTTKISKSMPARTSTTTQKTRSAKTADLSDPNFWGILMLGSVGVLYGWMRFEQNRE